MGYNSLMPVQTIWGSQNIMNPDYLQNMGYSTPAVLSPEQAQLWQPQWGAMPAAGPAMANYPGPETTKFGANLGTANAVFSGLQTLGGLWSSFQQNKMAKKAQKIALAFANKNLENQTMAYNSHVEDVGRSRALMEGMSPGQAQAYLDSTKLKYSAIGR